MERFRIVTTQGLSFQQLMKKNNVNPSGFISATDNVFTNQNWEITTTWESKKHFEESLNNPMKKCIGLYVVELEQILLIQKVGL
jgi:hypothetical protein